MEISFAGKLTYFFGPAERKEQAKKDHCPGGLYTDGGHEHVADYFLYALYHTEQTSDHGDKHAEQ